MKKKNILFLKILIFWGFSINVFGQSTEPDSNYYKVYDDYLGEYNNELYKGRGYSQKYVAVDNTHVFLYNNFFQNGFVVFEKQPYFTELKYDIFNDLLIVKYIDDKNPFSISLNSESVSQFEIGNAKFVRLNNTNSLSDFYKNGFYEIVYQGNRYSLYAKHLKSAISKTNYQTLHFLIKEKAIYYLKYKDRFYKIKTKRDLIKVLPYFKDEIKSFFNDNVIEPKALAVLLIKLENI